jgi:hypothetical protein
MDFQKTLIRSSSVGYLMTEPVTKADKEAGILSKTAKSHLIEIYIREKYGRRKDVQTKQMRKGVEVEDDAIELLAQSLGRPLSKNTERFSNDFITGHPDVLDLTEAGLKVWDVKSSYDLFTFLGNIPDKLNSQYYWQLQSYMWLTGATESCIAYCLINTPFGIMEQEKKSLLYKMNVISDESPEYVLEAAKLELNMMFDDIDQKERLLLFPVQRNDEDIELIKQKVSKARVFLESIEETHLNFNNGKGI